MFAMADLRRSEEDVTKTLQGFQDNLTNLRRRYAEDKRHRESITKLVKYLTETENPKITVNLNP